MADIQSMHEKAAQYYENKELNLALELYEEIIKLNPADEIALSCVMDIYLELDDKLNYYLARANVNISQNKIEYAINDTKKALELDFENVNTRRKLARLYKVSGKNLKAIDEFLRIMEYSTKELDVYFELAELYMQENELDSAISIAQQGYEIFSDNANLKNLLAQLYFRANDYENALKVVEDEFLRIKILLQDEKNDEAYDLLKNIYVDNLDKNQRRSYYILKAQYLYNKKEFEKALVEVDNYCEVSIPDAISFQMKALIYEELNDEFNSYLNWGFCKKKQNKIDEAIVDFEHAYQINSQNKTVLIELANLYAQNNEKFVSIEFWQKVYDIDGDKQAKEILAEFYYSEGNFQKAEEYGKVLEKKEAPEENYIGLLDRIMSLFSKK